LQQKSAPEINSKKGSRAAKGKNGAGTLSEKTRPGGGEADSKKVGPGGAPAGTHSKRRGRVAVKRAAFEFLRVFTASPGNVRDSRNCQGSTA